MEEVKILDAMIECDFLPIPSSQRPVTSASNYYPEKGDALNWLLWYYEKNGTYYGMIDAVLRIFESDFWCLLSRVKANPDDTRAVVQLENTLSFLTYKTPFHAGLVPYRDALRKSRLEWEIFNGVFEYPRLWI